MGIDPGSLKTGWGVVSVRGQAVKGVAWGVIRLKSGAPLVERLKIIYDELSVVIQEYQPAEVAVEGIFQSGNTKNFASTLKLGHARGAALLAVAGKEIPLSEYAPAAVKKALTGRGRADKNQVKEMIRAVLGIAESPPEDAADALAVATCHAFRLQYPVVGTLR